MIRVEDHMGLVGFMTKKFVTSQTIRKTSLYDTEEYSDGCFGLVNAAKYYREDRAAFSTYACYCIRNAIVNGLRKRKKRCVFESIGRYDEAVECDGFNRVDNREWTDFVKQWLNTPKEDARLERNT